MGSTSVFRPWWNHTVFQKEGQLFEFLMIFPCLPNNWSHPNAITLNNGRVKILMLVCICDKASGMYAYHLMYFSMYAIKQLQPWWIANWYVRCICVQTTIQGLYYYYSVHFQRMLRYKGVLQITGMKTNANSKQHIHTQRLNRSTSVL